MRKWITWGIAGVVLVGGGFVVARSFNVVSNVVSREGQVPSYALPSPMAKWPLRQPKVEVLLPGVTHELAMGSDGTILDFIDFDFKANPRLRFEIFDQDEDDDKPFDNHAMIQRRNVVKATQQLIWEGRGPIIAAWNGAFFDYDKETGRAAAFHVSPVVLRGKEHFNTANHRWMFGVKQTPAGPQWKVIFKPSRQVAEKEFDYAAGGVQCLVKDGKPLKIEPFPPVGGSFKKQPVPSSALEAGHIPKFDHIRTSRASIGWSRDNQHLYLLIVKEPDDESGSSAALAWAVRGGPVPANTKLEGGWTLSDVQKFWLSKGVWGAINSDAGDAMQLVYRHDQGSYTFVPPRQISGDMRRDVDGQFYGAQTWGGTIMYFMVREK